ncbi:MAG: hypothetical protein CL663_04955, partial [Bacteroidetes bacterium]|nr:hypothetical protein [Bacteroidota bacterium]
MKLVYRLFNALHFFLYVLGSKAYNAISLSVHNINYQKDIIINGYPKFNIHKNGKLIIGNCFKLNSGNVFNSIGRNQRSLISVGNNASLEIGNNVGMSSVAIVCQK